MCIGIPMQVLRVDGRLALCEGRGERRQVGTALVGAVDAGDWLLVFLGEAREAIDAARAAEVDAALDLLLGAMSGGNPAGEVAFALPSQRTQEHMRALTSPSNKDFP